MKSMTIREYFAKTKARKAKRAQKRAELGLGGRPKAKRPPSPRERLRARLDALWSLFVRRRDSKRNGGLCIICGSRLIQVGYHIIPRGDDATRWDPENGVGACASCNWSEKNHRLKYREKHIKIFGWARIEALEAKARTIVHFTESDLAEKVQFFKAQLEAI